MSSLPVMGDQLSGYMAQMMMSQGREIKQPWTFIGQLQKKYEVESVPTDVNDINDVDILLVIHPKDLPEKTLFAIDQFILKGGRTIVCVDPHFFYERPDRTMMQMGMQVSRSSELNKLTRTWGIEMPANTFAGDRSLADFVGVGGQRPEKLISLLKLVPEWNCFNKYNVITTELNEVKLLFPGVLKEIADSNDTQQAQITRTPLITTTSKGNSFPVNNPYELIRPNPSNLVRKFVDGIEPVTMGYMITGRFKSSFPDGIEIEVEVEDDGSDEAKDPNDVKKIKRQIKGLTEAQEDCAVVVFADVDFICDRVAYINSFFGRIVAGDNSVLVLNTIDDLGGSGDLISIRSRGNFKRPFTVVDEIERQAEAETHQEVERLNALIIGFQNELQSILTSAQKGQEEVIGSSILEKQRDIEYKQRQAQQQLNEVRLKRRERIEHLGNVLRGLNMLVAPAIILVIAMVLGLRRGLRKRHYISHASDA
jgi:ABC-type uncharacterized transport system involved in gliding motility auxiliary subunit